MFKSFSMTKLSAAMLLLVAVSTTGCVGFMSQVMWITGQGNVPAECDKLEGKRVAVVCDSGASAYSPGSESQKIARSVAILLSRNVDDVEIVDQGDVLDWIDNNDASQLDYREIGRGVDADIVVGIDLSSFRIREGKTLLRGRADMSVLVYDMNEKNGALIFQKDIPDFTWPENGGHPSTEDDRKFQNSFIVQLSHRVARLFYPYDYVETYGNDANMSGL